MLPIAGQMAGLIGLKFIVDAPRVKGKKKIFKFFFHGQRRVLQLVHNKIK